MSGWSHTAGNGWNCGTGNDRCCGHRWDGEWLILWDREWPGLWPQVGQGMASAVGQGMARAAATGGTGQSSSWFCCCSLSKVSSGLKKQKKERIYFVKCVVWFSLVCSVWPLALGWVGQAFPAPPGALLALEVPV